jgi:hypothetical protein
MGSSFYCRVSRLATVCEVVSGVVSELVFRNTMDRGTWPTRHLRALVWLAWAACWQSSTSRAVLACLVCVPHTGTAPRSRARGLDWKGKGLKGEKGYEDGQLR